MKKTVTILNVIFLGGLLLVSCKSNPTDVVHEETKITAGTLQDIPDEDAIADAKLDEENIEDEKTKISFTISKSVKDQFTESIKGLKRIESRTINDTILFEVYKQGGNEDGPEWDFKAIIRIGDYYLPIRLGIDHSIKIQDLVYNDDMQEIIINTGCFSDAGCLDKRMVIRTFKRRAFTLTDFGEGSNIYLTYKDLDGYSFPGYREKLGSVLDSKELIIINRDYYNGQLVIQSYKPYKVGFAKGAFTKKISIEIAG